jgi:hypothetical protein
MSAIWLQSGHQPAIVYQSRFMMGWTPPDGIGVPKVEVLSTT